MENNNEECPRATFMGSIGVHEIPDTFAPDSNLGDSDLMKYLSLTL